ncbi:hypothetical protein CWI38_1512p0020 [Hamiltosporidium tvaerminnensis]|uniref:Uncharacterized protein n=1 Tax=Hamiltosporidium tvaerminnensis TaxID=1176355 RepID=A0A4Q9LR39_9MICR|nr:hypothetical protein CWI38_1512p0020 [Hamiltosporidium tvaerminnensis]
MDIVEGVNNSRDIKEGGVSKGSMLEGVSSMDIVEGVNNSRDIKEGGVSYKDIVEGVSSMDVVEGVSYKDIVEGVSKGTSNYKGVINSTNKQHPVNNITDTYHPLNDSTDTYHPVNNTTNNTPSYTWLFTYYDILKDKLKGKEYEIINNKEITSKNKKDYKGFTNKGLDSHDINKGFINKELTSKSNKDTNKDTNKDNKGLINKELTSNYNKDINGFINKELTSNDINNQSCKLSPFSIKVRFYKAIVVEEGVNYSNIDNVCYLLIKEVNSSNKKEWVWVVNKGVIDKVYVSSIKGCYYSVVEGVIVFRSSSDKRGIKGVIVFRSSKGVIVLRSSIVVVVGNKGCYSIIGVVVVISRNSTRK